MDLNLTPGEQQFRDEFRAWLKANVPEEWKGGTGAEDREEYIKYLRDWQRKLYEGGWAGISWPKEFGGRGATVIEQAIFQEELARANAPQLVGTIGLSLVGPTIIAMGTAGQKARYLPKILSGEVLGEVNKGWATAITALMNERANLGTGIQVVFKRQLEALIARSRTVERNGRPASCDPLVRQKLAQAYLELEILRLNTNRALTSLSKSGIPGAEGSIQKLYWSEMNQRTQQYAQEILGPYGQLKEFDKGVWEYAYLRTRGNTIEAGTSEIQRNIIAERVLGLPKSY